MAGTILTNIGLSKLAAATPQNQLNITHIAVGNGNGGFPTLSPTMTALTNEVWRSTASNPIKDGSNSNYVYFETNIPPEVGPFDVREIACFDIDGDMIAIGHTSLIQKPAPAADANFAVAVKIFISLENATDFDLIYQNTEVTSHNSLSNINDIGGHDSIYARNVNCLKNLTEYAQRVDGQKFDVSGYYENTLVGGGTFTWDANRSKADHNGGTVIAPEAIAAWDGTQADIATILDWAGSGSGCFVRSEIDGRTNMSAFGTTTQGDSTKAVLAALQSGIPLEGTAGALYKMAEGLTIVDVPVDLDLNGSKLENVSATDRMITIEYPYLYVQDIQTVDLVGKSVTVGDASNYREGDRVKIVSKDRCIGNRPAPGDGRDYWQAQTMTVDSVSGNTLLFRESFESDYTFSTTPKIMVFNKKSCKIFNGSMGSEKGYTDSRNNGLLTVKGGSSHRLAFDVENANNTAVICIGCDNVLAEGAMVKNVGRATDVSSSHGYSFIACNAPKVNNVVFSRTRHGQTNNDTPTTFEDGEYYTMGPTYDMSVTDCVNTADTASAFSTHHGIRRALFKDNTAVGCTFGVGIRGRDVKVEGLKTQDCGEPVFVYSEAGMTTVDKTTRWYVGGVEAVATTGGQDLQVQNVQTGTLGSNNFKGGAPQGWFFNNAGTVVLQGNNEFFSSGTLPLDGNFLHTVNTNVENFGVLTVDIDGATINGTNNVIRCTSDRFFNSYGKIVTEEPVGMDYILRHIGGGEVYLADVTYSNNIGAPFNIINNDSEVKGRTKRGDYVTGYFFATASDGFSLNLNKAGDSEVTAVVLTNNGEFTMAGIDDGKFDGQKLLIRASGANGLVLDASIPNMSLQGPDVTVLDGESRRFTWGVNAWFIESRNA